MPSLSSLSFVAIVWSAAAVAVTSGSPLSASLSGIRMIQTAENATATAMTPAEIDALATAGGWWVVGGRWAVGGWLQLGDECACVAEVHRCGVGGPHNGIPPAEGCGRGREQRLPWL